jgi:regulator of PEP synthase PpsR (kinase-PPPase family)
LNHTSKYTDLEKIYEELEYSKQVFEKYGAYVIDVTDKSIEETAYVVEDYLKKLNSLG